MCNNICLEVSHSVAPLAPKNHPMWMQPEAVHKQNSTDTHTYSHTHTNYSTCLLSVFLINAEINHVDITIYQTPLKKMTRYIQLSISLLPVSLDDKTLNV